MKKYIKNKKSLFFVSLFAIVLVCLCGTFALWIWESLENQRTNIAFMVNKVYGGFTCSADGGGEITPDEVVIMPSTCSSTTNTIRREITTNIEFKNNDVFVLMDLWLDVNELGTALSESENFRYAVTTSATSCDSDVVVSGSFNGKTTGDKINILSKEFSRTSSDKYYLYIWLDKAETNVETANQNFNLSLSGTCEGMQGASEPVLDEGMIPVTISDDGTVKTISKDDSNWYDYMKQKWANIVLVSNSSRSNYLNTEDVVVNQSDILAYYVWIPRYSYKIWTTGVSSTGNEQSIDIKFEAKNDQMELGTQVGEYRTHPSFWWDDDSDGEFDQGETVAGIWVGKFETTGTADNPTIKPNSVSLGQTVSAQFNTSLLFSGGTLADGNVSFSGNDTYGLTSKTDSHMMKNSEWGAVAYLSHSQYGINEEIRINNYYADSQTLTGCGALTESEAESTICGILYGTPSTEKNTYPQSTTGNISGIFDMSGGRWQFTMGNYNNIIAGNGFSVLPSKKYYDEYTTTNVLTACDGGICYGHALSETKWWYDDNFYFATGEEPWFNYGGSSNDGNGSGIFSVGKSDGSAKNGSRSVLIPIDRYNVTFEPNGGSLSDDMYQETTSVMYTESGEHVYNVSNSGQYKLEVWGAQGGVRIAGGSSTTGYGGYSVGKVNLNSGTELYINVGGAGITKSGAGKIIAGGYNGGGKGYSYSGDSRGGASGGGATHIATKSGLLSTLSSSKDSILIVAGGGGGSDQCCDGFSKIAGSGGGYIGGSASYIGSNETGGTQSSGGIPDPLDSEGWTGSFGQGANCQKEDCAGGGGGYYGGAAVIGGGGYGSGGSGYIGNNLLTNKAMYCYSCPTSSGIDTLTYSTTSVSSTPTSNYAKGGDGAARITPYIVKGMEVLDNGVYGDMPVPTKEGYVFLGWYTEPEGGELVTGDTFVEIKEDHILYAHWDIASVNISLLANGGNITSSTTDGTNTYNWSLNNDFIYLNNQPLSYSIRNLETIELPNYNNESFLNLSKSNVVVSDGEEWICLVGCDRIGKTFDHDKEYSVVDFCGVNKSECSVILGVNWLNVYMITYDANGGSSAPAAQEKYYGVPTALTSTIPKKGSYEFLGWSTDPNATTPTYVAGDDFLVNENVTLYAIWASDSVAPTCSLSTNGSTITATYKDTGGSGMAYYGWDSSFSGTNSTSKTYSAATHTYYVKDNAGNVGACRFYYSGILRECYATIWNDRCVYWNGSTNVDIGWDYYCGEGWNEITNNFCWRTDVAYTVRYDANGGSGAPSPQVKDNDSSIKLSTVVPVKDGYVFLGWSSDKNATVQTYVPGDTYSANANIVLYAVWSVTEDTTLPTCTLSVNNNAVINAKYFDPAPSGGIGYYGWDSSFSGANSTSKTINGTGDYVYYVKDNFGNTNTCSVKVTSTSSYYDCPVYTSPTTMGGNIACYYYCGDLGDANGHCFTAKELVYTCPSGYSKLNNNYCYLTS